MSFSSRHHTPSQLGSKGTAAPRTTEVFSCDTAPLVILHVLRVLPPSVISVQESWTKGHVFPGGFSFRKQKLTVLYELGSERPVLCQSSRAQLSCSPSKCNPKNHPVATELGLQMASLQASRKRFPSGQQAVDQNKPVGRSPCD